MTAATVPPNPPSPNFFADLADQVVAKLDIRICRHVTELVEQEVQEIEKKELPELRAASEKNGAEIKARDGEVTALKEVIQVLKQHRNRLDPCRNRQDIVNCMIEWARQQVTESENKRTQLEGESPTDDQMLSACKAEIAAFNELIQTLETHRKTLEPYEEKQGKRRESSVNDLISWAERKLCDNEDKLAGLQAALQKNNADIGACTKKHSALEEVIFALKRCQNILDTYPGGQRQLQRDFVAVLAPALEDKKVAKQVKRATMHWLRSMSISNEALAERVGVRLQTEFVDKSTQFKNTLSAVLPKDSEVSRALDRYIRSLLELKQKLTADIEAELRKGLSFALMIWRKMDWPLPFGLVLYEELTELDGLRTKRQEETRKCLDALLSSDDEAREARKALHSRLSRFLAHDAKNGQPDNYFKAQARKTAVQALENYINNPQGDTKRALDDSKDVLIQMALEHIFKKLQPQHDSPIDAAAKGELVGLALSGGGIRSATFNLGVLQGLAHSSLLPLFDYLSTVSGGGYIGSWLLAWLKRKGFGKVSKQLRPDWKEHPDEEPPEIEFLRSYSNYLTPQRGLLSADTWSLAATWVRNFLLNLTVLVLVISALLLLPRWVVTLSHSGHPSIYLVFTVVFMLIAISFTGANLGLFSSRHKEFPRYSEQGAIQWAIVIPTVLASWLGSCWLWNAGRRFVDYPHAKVVWALWIGGLTFFIWLAASLFSLKRKQVEDSDRPTETAKPLVWPPLVFFSFLEGAVGGLLFFGLACLYGRWWKAAYPGNNVHFVAWGTGLVAGVFGIMVAIQIGLMGKRFPDERREWWSRVGAWVTIYALGWTALFALALYSPLVVLWGGPWLGSTATLGWLAHTIYGTLGARSAKTGGSGPTDGTGLLIKAAPSVFVLGLLALLSFFIYWVSPHESARAHHEKVAVAVNLNMSQELPGESAAVSASVDSARLNDKLSYRDLAKAYWCSSVRIDGRTGLWILGIALLCVFLAFLLSWRVDINEFSMHLLYRNRVVRCYLGASHQGEKLERNPNPFTGFDPDDDILLAHFAQGAPLKHDETEYVGPYPILNATLNVTHGKRLAWQERKAESFVFTPRYCGYDVKADWQPRVEKRNKPLEDAGYRPTGDYLYSEEGCPGGPYLGTAVGISGAAISPNMGYHSDSALAFLMTVFDVRLGWWAGNTRHQGGRWTGNPRYKLSWKGTAPPWKRRGPGLGILYLLLELFGSTDDERAYVYLSDGGHFENLGIYELVRRGCRLVLVCDASEDPDYKFEGLGNAIRKCRIDLGVDIDPLPVKNLRPKANKKDDTKWSQGHHALGIIHYEKLDASRKPGILVYLKASLTGNEPTDVLDYKSQHPKFPHDATANQFFTESQFESYRKLGEHVIGTCLKKKALKQKGGESRQGPTVLDVIQKPELWDGLAKDLEHRLKSAVQRHKQAGAAPKPGSADQPPSPAREAPGESSAPVSS
jgi:hypothetical protein